MLLIPAACLALGLSACADGAGDNAAGGAAPETAVGQGAREGSDEGAAAAPSEPATSPQTPTPETSSPPPVPLPATQRERAASLLMAPVVNFDDALYKLNAGVGGIFIPSWADPALLTEPGRDLHALRQMVGRPFDISIDFEGGRVQRFTKVFGAFPTPRQMGTEGPEAVRRYGFQIGQALLSRGVSVDFAPVLDIDGQGLDVVGDRAFSTDPHEAAALGVQFAAGLEDAGVDSVFKHYPGHGRASGDTHLGPAVTPPLGEVMGFDAVPFAEATAAEPRSAMMVGHMVVPGLGDGVTPSSLNSHAYGLLRNVHGFDGLVYTDDLTGMKAITDIYAPADAVVAAIAAGADVALWSAEMDINYVIDRVDAAVTEGRINRHRFDAAVMRVAEQLHAQ